jgi:hypothetical protein
MTEPSVEYQIALSRGRFDFDRDGGAAIAAGS